MRGWLDHLQVLLAKRFGMLLIISGSIVIGALNALPHMQEALWQDEAATIVFHSTRGMLSPFLHYMAPNNHIAFSSMLAAWIALFPDGIDIFSLRLLPLLLFLGAIPVTYFAALRLGGPLCAVVSSISFSISPVTANFATQLRGYGPSWIFMSALLLCGANSFAARGARMWRLGYAFACFGAVALLPTNFYFSNLAAVALTAYHLACGTRIDRSTMRGYAVILIVPAISLILAYGSVWNELMSFRHVGFSNWNLTGLARDWLHGIWASFGWLSVLTGAGIAVGLYATIQAFYSRKPEIAPEFLAAIILIVGFGFAVASIPTVPFPRSLVPYLPLWLIAMSMLVSHGLTSLRQGGRGLAFGIGAAAFLLPSWAAPPVASCRNSAGSGDPFEYTLCHQYFRDHYYPSRVLDVWASLQHDDIPIVSDFEGFRALQILGSRAKVYEYRNFQPSDLMAPIFVAHGRPEMERMAGYLGLRSKSYVLIADTGYFKVYGAVAPP